MHETFDAFRSPAHEDAPAPPDASRSIAPGDPRKNDPITPPPPPAIPLPPAWVKARAEQQVYHPHPSPVWPRAWSSVAAWLAALAMLAVVLAPIPPSGSDLYAAAAQARIARRYDLALAFYARAARQDAADPRAYCLTGEVLALQQQYARAVAAYADCQRLGDHSGNVWLALGDIAQARGDASSAERDWLRAAGLGSETARRRLGLFYESRAEFDLARAQWQRLPASDAVARVHLGLLALRSGDYDTARTEFIAARGLPGFAAQDAVDQGFVQLAAIGPSDAVGLTAIGVAFIKAGMPAFAHQPLQRALALAPASGSAHAALAWVERLAGETAAAQSDSTRALQLIPTDSFALFVAAELALDAHQWATAVNLLDQALRTDGKNAELWAEHGRAQLAQLDYLHAELSYEMAERFATDPAYGRLFLSFYIQFHLGLDDGRALAAARETTQRWQSDASVWELAGQVYALEGESSLAVAAYQRANQLEPGMPRPYLDLGQLAFSSQQYVVAARDLRTGLALQPDGPLAGQFRALLVVLADYDV